MGLLLVSAALDQLNPLPAVPQELSTITKIWGGQSFLDEKFTLNTLNSEHSRQHFGIVHLATHGVFGTEAANSYIQFWGDSQFKLSQMQKDLGLNSNKNSPVELLVLSACETALGDKKAELGFGGLAYKTGVKTALASLWKVNDVGTLGLMTEFYKSLKKVRIKSQGLQQAQLAMIRGELFIENGQLRKKGEREGIPLSAETLESIKDKKLNLKHPYYWAPFTMIGNPW
jgi:CHAT domain-containing protein